MENLNIHSVVTHSLVRLLTKEIPETQISLSVVKKILLTIKLGTPLKLYLLKKMLQRLMTHFYYRIKIGGIWFFLMKTNWQILLLYLQPLKS